MSRALRIELRRSFGIATTVMVVVVGAIMLYAATKRWSVSWMELASIQREYLVLLWPLAISAGAYQARREHRSKVEELFASTPRPRRQRVLPTLGALGISVAVGYVLMIAIAVPWIWDTARYLPAAAFAVAAVGVLAMVAAAWLGMAVGRLLPSPVTAPLLGVGALAFAFFLPFAVEEWLGALISPMADMGAFHDYQTIPGRVSGGQAIWLTGLAVAAFVLLAAGTRRTRLTALVPALLGLVVGAAVMPRGDDYVYPAIDPVAQQMVCTPDLPRVCVARVHEGLLPEVVPPARKALALLARVPGAPTTAEEDVITYSEQDRPAAPGPDVVLIPVTVDRTGHLAWPDRVVPRMLNAAGASGRGCEKGGAPLDMARAAGSWLSGVAPVSEADESPGDNDSAIAMWQKLRELPEKEALARVTALRKAVLACDQTITLDRPVTTP